MASKNFAKNVKRILAERNLNVTWLSRKVGIAPTTIYSWLNYKAIPILDNAYKVANGLGTELSELLKGVK